MSKPVRQRRLDAQSAMAKASTIRGSARKLNLVAQLIRGKQVGVALNALRFEKRRMANEVSKVLRAAIANAENNHQLDVDRLIVSEATVGRTFVMKRFHARARGRGAGIEKPYSNLTVVVRERGEDEGKKAKKTAKAETETKAAAPKAKKAAGTKAKTAAAKKE